jgi:kynurenine formamidase
VEDSRALDYLVQAYVKAVGHNGLSTGQVLTGLAAMESWLDSGMTPGPAAFPAALGFDSSYVPAPWPY